MTSKNSTQTSSYFALFVKNKYRKILFLLSIVAIAFGGWFFDAALANANTANSCLQQSGTSTNSPSKGHRPDYLQAVTDPEFGTDIIRITDPGQPLFNPKGHRSLAGISWDEKLARHRYSSFSAWNADGSLMVISRGTPGFLFIDGHSYQPLFRTKPPGDVRWHPTRPDVMIYAGRSDIGLWNPATNRKERSYVIPGYRNFKWGRQKGAKGKPTHDGTKAIFLAENDSSGKTVALIVDIEEGNSFQEVEFEQHIAIGKSAGIYLSPLGNYYEVYGCIKGHEDDRCHARIVFDLDGNELWRELGYHIPGHWDYYVDKDQNQWIVGLAKGGPHAGKIIKRNFRTGDIVKLIDHAASHTSARNLHGDQPIALMSGFHRGPYKNEIVGVDLEKPGQITRYARSNVVPNGYFTEPHASFSPDGRKFVFATNWGEPKGAIASYVVTIPDNCP